MIEVQCTSCHTRYRIDEQVLPEEIPTFKCSRCGHVFTLEPRGPELAAARRSGAKAPDPSSAEANERQYASDKASDRATIEASSAAPIGAQEDPRATEPQRSDDFLSRPFDEHNDDARLQDGLRFDFRDEEHPPDDAPIHERAMPDESPSLNRWRAGNDIGLEERPEGEKRGNEAMGRPRGRRRPGLRDDDFVDDEAAPIYNRGVMHSARFFLGLLLFVAMGFIGMTALIHNAPAAAADILSRFPMIGARFEQPMTLARMVALRDVHAVYQRSKDGKPALMITGTAENVGLRPLHVVQVAARLRDPAQRAVQTQAVYCGNNLSTKMVGEMTPHEIEFFQKLDPPKSFALEPSGSCPFVIVFIDPPSGINRFDIAVAQASPAPSDSAATPGL